ncbi:O-methyltransferase [Polaribacter aquimarinus]|uniref:Methyltransferase n=1 Tax=Polaribacter aquimarinus TaxID=2100726 RepID=A0A2U2J912_9FLAO|nr:class I SAM-dependent methyltransferase [Polaribacter aquimarinus]PWG04829.1 methyltransferase [Polaribacter aquimarinus]
MLTQYLKFITKSTNQHGVHSPFVYILVTKCFYTKIDNGLWKLFLGFKNQLLDNQSTIKVTDFGSGSKTFKTNKRKVSKIVKVAAVSNKKAKLLIKIVKYFKPENSLEIGTSIGLGTSAIKVGYQNSKITTLEGCPETAKIAQVLFKNNHLKNIDNIIGNFDEILPKVINNKKLDFIYFDGNHTKKATLAYFNICLSSIKNDSFWIFDDIYWNKEMEEAWLEIKNHPKVRVTVDVFHFGIVFFRKEQAKEHFKIRV